MVATEEVARPEPAAAADAAGSLKPKIDDDHVDAILTIDLDRRNKKARSADEAYDQITYDQINHEVIHEAPDSPVELALPPPP